ncbi:MAG: DUF3352 domain-containing protein [Synechococcales cyanobacterium RM1_1_8]|nr:DUF3352 domain-containing protein [Synechococcales cyanobacterium RM1_1_8]
MTTSRRSFPSALIAVALALLLSGLGALWLLGAMPLGLLGRAPGEPTAAMFVPRQAPLMVSLVVNPDRLTQLRQLLTPPGQRRSGRAELQQLQDGLLAPADLDYRQDIQPWLGDEVTLAVTQLDLDRDPDNGEQPGYLLALATRKPQRAREFLQLYWQRRAADGTVLHLEQVSGVQMIYAEPPGTDAGPSGGGSPASSGQTSAGHFASALVGDRYVLFANQPKVLRDAINNVQVPELNLLNSPRYRQALAALTGPRLALLFANANGLGGWIEHQGLTVGTRQLPGSSHAQEPKNQGLYDGLALSLGAQRRGLVGDLALLMPAPGALPGAANKKDQPDAGDGPDPSPRLNPDRVLQYLPSNSAIALASSHLDQFWQSTQTVLETYPAIATLANRALGQLEAQWDINFTREIFPWVTGEYAIGQLERPRSPSDWIFVVDRTSPDAQAGIAHLDDLARQQGYSLGNLTLADQDVTAWTRLKSESQQDSADTALRAFVRGVHTTVGKPDRTASKTNTGKAASAPPVYEVFATSLEAMEAVLNTADPARAKPWPPAQTSVGRSPPCPRSTGATSTSTGPKAKRP